MNRTALKPLLFVAILLLAVVLSASPIFAAVGPTPPQTPETTQDSQPGGAGSVDPNIRININGEGSDAVRILLLLTVITLLPSILVMMTSFTRIVVVFSLLRNALGLQQTPPNQVLIGLALFLSLFIMNPVLTNINNNAYQPYSNGDISAEQFLARASDPLREFMLKQTNPEDLNLFLSISGRETRPQVIGEYSMTVVIPSFITSELKRAFLIGFLIFIPFLIIDMVVASALMSMGMMMLPPVTISMPFKLMLFVLVDGWGLLIKTLLSTYNL